MVCIDQVNADRSYESLNHFGWSLDSKSNITRIIRFISSGTINTIIVTWDNFWWVWSDMKFRGLLRPDILYPVILPWRKKAPYIHYFYLLEEGGDDAEAKIAEAKDGVASLSIRGTAKVSYNYLVLIYPFRDNVTCFTFELAETNMFLFSSQVPLRSWSLNGRKSQTTSRVGEQHVTWAIWGIISLLYNLGVV